MTVRFGAKQPEKRQVLALLCVMLIGCSHSARNLSLDKEQAREACKTFLTAWKNGDTYIDLEPDITGRDHDWDAKKKLVAFELLPNETNDGTNLHIPVRLTLKDTQRRETQTVGTYTVGTSPVVTVFRENDE